MAIKDETQVSVNIGLNLNGLNEFKPPYFKPKMLSMTLTPFLEMSIAHSYTISPIHGIDKQYQLLMNHSNLLQAPDIIPAIVMIIEDPLISKLAKVICVDANLSRWSNAILPAKHTQLYKTLRQVNDSMGLLINAIAEESDVPRYLTVSAHDFSICPDPTVIKELIGQFTTKQ